MNSYSLKAANWSCPSLEQGFTPDIITQNTFASWENAEYVVEQVKKRQEESPEQGVILPIWQNLEAIAIGRTLNDDDSYPLPGQYLIEELDELDGLAFDLLHQPVIQANLEAIRQLRAQNEPVILQAEAPFSILAALMNPMDLYLCFMEDGERLKKILYQLACAESEYIKEALRSGCEIISLADPVGTMNMIGEKYYKEFCGLSEIQLMRQIDSSLDRGIVHICKKMSQSLAIADLVTVEDYSGQITTGDFADQTGQITAGNCAEQIRTGDYSGQITAGGYSGQNVMTNVKEEHPPVSHLHVLKTMAEDPHIHFTGMTCIHNRVPDLKQSKILYIKPDIGI